MNRLRRLMMLLLCLLLFAPRALAQTATMPTREIYSIGYAQIQTALERDRPVTWYATIEPRKMEGFDDNTLEAMRALVSALRLEGEVQTFEGGGYMDMRLTVSGQEILGGAQMTQDGRKAIRLDQAWYSMAEGEEASAAEILGLDAMNQSLLDTDYTALRAGDIPFWSAIYREGLTLWNLASPYSEDSNSLSVPSGKTSHATVYEIDTYGLRSMLDEWVNNLTGDGLTAGMDIAGLGLGISDEMFEEFVGKARAFADTVELSKPIKLSLTYGEADVLRTAKGSGTLQEGSRRTPISYSYTCNLSNTKLTRKYAIDFQPREGDTLVFNATWSTSSNNSRSGAQDITFTASGRYNGKDYRIRMESKMTNKYALGANDVLAEALAGTLTLSVRYDGQKVLDVTVKRKGETSAKAGTTTAATVVDTFDILIMRADATVFDGIITLGLQADAGEGEIPNYMEKAFAYESMDFIALETLRSAQGTNAEDTLRQRLIQALPTQVLGAIMGNSTTP